MRIYTAFIFLTFLLIFFLLFLNFPCLENGRSYTTAELREITLNYDLERRSRSFSNVENWYQLMGGARIDVEKHGTNLITQIIGADSYTVEIVDDFGNSIISMDACGSVTSRSFVEW